MTNVIETRQLGCRYGRKWALQDCTLQLPAQRVIGLVGPNGAGKSTLLHLAVGLLRPTKGSLSVLGESPASSRVRSRIGFVAQDKPLYRGFTVTDTLRMGGWLNPGWDHQRAERRLAQLNIPLNQRVGKLSGGQRAQVALALALGKRPDLLLLDEPVANLDPLARRDFMRSLMEDVAETGRTVVLSSHLIADLERTCDHLVLLSASRVQLSGDVEELLAAHLILSGPRAKVAAIQATHTVVQADYSERQAILLIRTNGPVHDPAWSVRPATLEELVLAYMGRPDVGALSDPRLVDDPTEVLT